MGNTVWILLSLGMGILWGFATANVAERKGYNAGVAGLLGFLLGWLPLLIYYLMPDVSEGGAVPKGPKLGPQAQRQAQFEESIPPGGCRICKYVNSAGSSRCYQCGNML